MPRLRQPRIELPTTPGLTHELLLRERGYQCIAGIDEAGRGAWAGPVVAAAVVIPMTSDITATLRGVTDSKKLTPRRREFLHSVIEQSCIAHGIGSASNQEIDGGGIIAATRLAMTRAIRAMSCAPDALVIDAVHLPDIDIHQDVFYFADAISLSVAAASIIAKTERDRIMQDLDTQAPGYSFARHKGYGTQKHIQALGRLGVSSYHRLSYAPIKQLLASQEDQPIHE